MRTTSPSDLKQTAYLILAHHQPRLLRRLVSALDGPDTLLFIHVDGRRGLEPFVDLVPDKPNIRMLGNRVDTYWGGYSLLRAILRLCREALDAGDDIRRFTLLSGTDYPVRHREQIRRNLLQSEKNFIRIERRLDRDVPWHYGRKTRCYHFYDNFILNPRGSDHVLARQCRTLVRTATALLPVRKYPQGMTPYHGSAWWSLTRDCLVYVLNYLDRHPAFLDYHRYVSTPEEIMLHTLIKNSPFEPTMTGSVDSGLGNGRERVYGLHYIDWRRHGGPLPRVLQPDDLPAILESGAFFARKMDENISGGLLDRIDALTHDIEPESA